MAGSLLPATQSTHDLTTLSPVEKLAVRLIAEGQDHRVVAQKLAKGDPKKAQYWRNRFRQLTWAIAMAAGEEAQLTMVSGLAPVSRAVVKRGKRGRVDAAKLIYEATGFHNTKVKHEHSGEVNINLKGLTRPPSVETEDSVVDADVVED